MPRSPFMPNARCAGVGDSRKTELVLLCAALHQCPTSAKPTLGIKGGEKPKDQAAGDFAGLFVSLGFLLISPLRPNARCAGVGDLGKWRLAL